MGYNFRHVLILLKGCARGIFHGKDSHVLMILPENLYNGSPGFCALVIWEETPSTLPVSRPMDSLLQLTRKHCVMVAPG